MSYQARLDVYIMHKKHDRKENDRFGKPHDRHRRDDKPFSDHLHHRQKRAERSEEINQRDQKDIVVNASDLKDFLKWKEERDHKNERRMARQMRRREYPKDEHGQKRKLHKHHNH